MPCDTQYIVGMTKEQREASILDSLRRLEAQLLSGSVQFVIGPNGEIAFANWKERGMPAVADVCAFRRLSVQNSFALQQAIANAEMQTGRKVNQQQVGSGTHSHDGGQTWHPGH